MARLEGIQRAIGNNHHNGLIKLDRKLRKELDDTLHQEELHWFQQSREDWIHSGDRNTSFYHNAMKIRKARAKSFQIKEPNGEVYMNEDNAKAIVQDYFSTIFAEENQNRDVGIMRGEFPRPDSKTLDFMSTPLTSDEIKETMFDMAPFKAPGLDGFHAGFYQSQWSIVGNAVANQAKVFFTTGKMPEKLNDALVSLIPKVDNPELVSQFRPISLCNVGYKVITKAMTNRIKYVIRGLIGPEQSSFVPGKQITDNIVVYQEFLHSLRRKKGSKGLMVLKIDLEKAYDRLAWRFIKDTLEVAGFDNTWVRNIMACISTCRLGVIWNGEQLDWIEPSRGIRQGDAISPYIFVLCIERLSHIIRDLVRRGLWKGIRLNRGGPLLSHLLFADDMVLFSEASEEQIRVIKECLDKFSEASGQKISLSKSQIMFSQNVTEELAIRISGIARMNRTNNMGKYLGVPSIHGRVTNGLFNPILERMNARLEGWKTRNLFASRKNDHGTIGSLDYPVLCHAINANS